MSKTKAAAIILAIIISCLAGCLFFAIGNADDSSKKDTGTKGFQTQKLANAATAISVETTTATTTASKTTTAKKVTTAAVTSAQTTTASTTVSTTDAESTSSTTTTETTTATTATTTETQPVVTETVTEAVTEAASETVAAETQPVTEYIQPEEVYYYQEVYTYEDYSYEETTAYYEPVQEQTTSYYEEEPYTEVSGNTLPISDTDYIILCNAVAHEAGCNWISEYEKALVVEVIMNRVYSSLYPDTIYGVLTQQYQFSGAWSYVNLTTYSSDVTENVKSAVNLYFNEPESFTQGYLSFSGDGYRNYFR